MKHTKIAVPRFTTQRPVTRHWTNTAVRWRLTVEHVHVHAGGQAFVGRSNHLGVGIE